MVTKWFPLVELFGSAKHPDRPSEAAEAYKDRFNGDEFRVVAVEGGGGVDEETILIERAFGDDDGGWVNIGSEHDPDLDLHVVIDGLQESGMLDPTTRLVFDYTNGELRLEAWVDPE